MVKMTIKEMIDGLSKYPLNTEVLLVTDFNPWCDFEPQTTNKVKIIGGNGVVYIDKGDI